MLPHNIETLSHDHWLLWRYCTPQIRPTYRMIWRRMSRHVDSAAACDDVKWLVRRLLWCNCPLLVTSHWFCVQYSNTSNTVRDSMWHNGRLWLAFEGNFSRCKPIHDQSWRIVKVLISHPIMINWQTFIPLMLNYFRHTFSQNCAAELCHNYCIRDWRFHRMYSNQNSKSSGINWAWNN